MRKETTKKVFYTSTVAALLAGTAVTGVNAVAQNDDMKTFDKDAYTAGENVEDKQAYPYSAEPEDTTEERPQPKEKRDNIKPLVPDSGVVNCKSGEACIDPKTNKARVEYQVQLSAAGVQSTNDGLTIDRGGEIAIPNVLKNVEVKMDSYYPGENTAKKANIPQELIEVNSKLPVFESSESSAEKSYHNEMKIYDDFNNAVAKIPEEESEGYVDWKKYWDEHPEKQPERFQHFLRNNPIMLYDTTKMKYENEGEDVDLNMGKLYESVVMTWDSWFIQDLDDSYKTNSDLYNYLKVPSFDYSGIMTLTISGDVEVSPDVEEAYLPIKAQQKIAMCSSLMEEYGGMSDYRSGCMVFNGHPWQHTGDLPKYDINDPEVNEELKKNYSTDGLTGNKHCSVTKDIGRKDRIGSDIEPIDLNKYVALEDIYRLSKGLTIDQTNNVKYHLQVPLEEGVITEEDVKKYGDWRISPYPREVAGLPAIHSLGDMYNYYFNLDRNEDSDYYVAGYGVDEDGCDQAAVKIVRCPEDETPAPTPTTEIPPVVPPTKTSVITSPVPYPVNSTRVVTETSDREVPVVEEKPVDREVPITVTNTLAPQAPAIPPAQGNTIINNSVNPAPQVINPAPVLNIQSQPIVVAGYGEQDTPVVETGGQVRVNIWKKIVDLFR